ncbi:MAG: 50S ribosomal protein L15 [Deltaproteobacteria bacterium RBG_16_54_18]|nr:MAG: 50S ribosomal protein L15 [Deltaproteobacteria bacterium RBG_16_54_18]
MLGKLQPPRGAKKRPKRVGRGPGSGHGKTSCKGSKGQKARSGAPIRPGFEGGQMPLQRRLPKRGFRNIFKERFALVNVKDLNRFSAGAVVDIEALQKAGLVKKVYDGVKILGDGDLQVAVTVKAHKFTEAARKKIEAAAGKVEVA